MNSRLAWLVLVLVSLVAADEPAAELVWRQNVKGGVYATPTVVDGVVYLGGCDKSVYALDAQTGDVKWQTPAGDLVYAGVVVTSDTVLAAAQNGQLLALDRATGVPRWDRDLSDTVYATPVLADGRLYVGLGKTGWLLALDPLDGHELWRHPMGDRMGAGLTVDGGQVFVGSYDHYLYCLDAVSGRLQWQFVTGGIVDSPPLATADTVYVKLPDDTVYAIDRAHGRERWRQLPAKPAAERDKTANWSRLVLADGLLLFGSADKSLHALDSATGQPRWTLPCGTGLGNGPAVDGGIGWLGGKNGSLLKVDLATGKLLGSWVPQREEGAPKEGLLSGVMWPPAVVDGMLYVASMEGFVAALKPTP